MIGENKGYLLDRPYQADFEHFGRYALSWLQEIAKAEGDHEKVRALLREKNVTMLLINWDYFFWVLKLEPPRHRDRLKFALLDLLRFIDKHSSSIRGYGDHWLVRIK